MDKRQGRPARLEIGQEVVRTPETIFEEAHGKAIRRPMRRLGENMAWLLKCIEAGRRAGITLPQGEKKIMTNFIR